jgi:hypothetical protein
MSETERKYQRLRVHLPDDNVDVHHDERAHATCAQVLVLQHTLLLRDGASSGKHQYHRERGRKQQKRDGESGVTRKQVMVHTRASESTS